jgi:hypothetical protein
VIDMKSLARRKKRGDSSIGKLLLVIVFVIPLIAIAGFLAILPQTGNNRSSVYPPQNLTEPIAPGFNVSGIQLYYADALKAAAQTLNATSVIVGFPVGIVPSQFQAIVQKANNLIQNYTNQMSGAESSYHSGLSLAQFGDYVDAATQLPLASSEARTANSTLYLLDTSFASMNLEGIPTSAVQPGMQTLHGQVSKLFSEVSSEASFVQRVQSGALAAANLTLKADPRTVKIGENITVSGTLYSKHVPLTNQSVSIAYQGIHVGVAITDSTGNFSLGFTTPRNYTSTANITAGFLAPSGKYAPVEAVTFVQVSFYTALLSLTSIPGVVVPGETYGFSLNVTLVPSGSATFPAPPENISSSVFGQESNITYTGTSNPEFFSLQFSVPSNTPDGSSNLAFNSTGDANYAPIQSSTTVQVVRQPISVNVNSPVFVNPFKQFRVSGNTFYGPQGNLTTLSSGVVKVTYGGTTLQQKLDSDGTFSFTLGPNTNTVAAGGALIVTVIPNNASIEIYNSTQIIGGVETSPGASTAILLVLAFACTAVYFGLQSGMARGKDKGGKSRKDSISGKKEPRIQKPQNTLQQRNQQEMGEPQK